MSSVRKTIRDLGLLTVAMFATFALSGCSDDNIVYRERAPFNTPADTTSGFIGYYNVSTKQTTCGNCHASYQASWKNTKHASAFAGLNASPGKQASCYGCHTVTGLGNAASGTTVGYSKIADSTYRDVQCESCHGAGLRHVESVGAGALVRPLAKLNAVGTGTCGDCHTGTHNPFAEEWAQSGHAAVKANYVANASCAGCHEGRAALARWGVNVNFQEKANATGYIAVATCAVCHDPHGSPNASQLRFPITSLDPEQNLCIKCHLNRGEPTVSSSSPHAPQGAMLLGFAGWRPPGFVYDTARIFGSHATEKNPKLCAGCHVGRLTVTDKATGAFSFQATGHLMRPVPCIDANGKPTTDKSCAYTPEARSWKTCTESGCHGSANAAVTAFTTVRSRMKFYTDQLWKDQNGNGSIQTTPTDAGLLATLKLTRPAEWSTTDNTITPAEGAEFNARVCGEYGASNSDNSKGIHNPFLCESLLIATINYLRSYYNLPAANNADPAMLPGPIGGEFNRGMRISRAAPK